MSIKLEGIVHSVQQTRAISDKFSIREAILTVDPSAQRPAYIPIQVINNNVDMFDGLSAGDKISVEVNLNGNLSKDGQKAYASFTVWKIDKANSAPPQAAKAAETFSIDDIDDDLPF